MIHPTAIVETDQIGEGTNIWAYAHVMPGAVVGSQCNIADRVFIEGGAKVGDQVTLKNNVCIWEGVTIQNGAFIGPSVTFTNDRYPRSPRLPQATHRYTDKQWLEETIVGVGCSIGAGAVICPGVKLGAFCTIAAGSVVTRDIDPFTLVVGNPGRAVGTVCICGRRLASAQGECEFCGVTESDRNSYLEQELEKSL